MHDRNDFTLFSMSLFAYLMLFVSINRCFGASIACRSIAFLLSFGFGAILYCGFRYFRLHSDTYFPIHYAHLLVCTATSLICWATILIRTAFFV